MKLLASQLFCLTFLDSGASVTVAIPRTFTLVSDRLADRPMSCLEAILVCRCCRQNNYISRVEKKKRRVCAVVDNRKLGRYFVSVMRMTNHERDKDDDISVI